MVVTEELQAELLELVKPYWLDYPSTIEDKPLTNLVTMVGMHTCNRIVLVPMGAGVKNMHVVKVVGLDKLVGIHNVNEGYQFIKCWGVDITKWWHLKEVEQELRECIDSDSK